MRSSPAQDRPSDTLLRPLFLWSLPFTFLYFWLPAVSKGFGASALGIGGLFSAFTLTTLALRPIVGRALDRFGRKAFFVVALVIYAAAMGTFALTDSLEWLYAARIIQGAGSALLWTATYTIVADLASPGEHGRSLGQITETTTRGGLVGVFAGVGLMSVLPDSLGWRAAFSGFAVMTLAAAWLAWRRVPHLKPAGEPVQARQTVISAELLRLLALVFVIGIPEAMLGPIYLIYLQDKFQVGVMTLAWAFFPAGLAAAFFSTRLGALSDRFGRFRMMALGLTGAGIVSLLMPGLQTLIGLAVLYTLSAIMWGIADPARTAMVVDLTGEQRRGTAYGLYDLAQNLGYAIGPVLGGLVYDAVGKSTPFYLDGAVLLVGTAFVLLFLGDGVAQNSRAGPGD